MIITQGNDARIAKQPGAGLIKRKKATEAQTRLLDALYTKQLSAVVEMTLCGNPRPGMPIFKEYVNR